MDSAKKSAPWKPGDPVPAGMVCCRRVEAVYTPEEHASCPYCYGKASDVAPGGYAKFCDFQPGKDPICFGFPDDKGRYRSK